MNWHDELRTKVARTMRELADRIDAEEDCMPSMTSIGDVDWTIKVRFPSEIPAATQREAEMVARREAAKKVTFCAGGVFGEAWSANDN